LAPTSCVTIQQDVLNVHLTVKIPEKTITLSVAGNVGKVTTGVNNAVNYHVHENRHPVLPIVLHLLMHHKEAHLISEIIHTLIL
jgi:hypothetical protein